MYWVNGRKEGSSPSIKRADMNGENTVDLITDGLSQPKRKNVMALFLIFFNHPFFRIKFSDNPKSWYQFCNVFLRSTVNTEWKGQEIKSSAYFFQSLSLRNKTVIR